MYHRILHIHGIKIFCVFVLFILLVFYIDLQIQIKIRRNMCLLKWHIVIKQFYSVEEDPVLIGQPATPSHLRESAWTLIDFPTCSVCYGLLLFAILKVDLRLQNHWRNIFANIRHGTYVIRLPDLSQSIWRIFADSPSDMAHRLTTISRELSKPRGVAKRSLTAYRRLSARLHWRYCSLALHHR